MQINNKSFLILFLAIGFSTVSFARDKCDKDFWNEVNRCRTVDDGSPGNVNRCVDAAEKVKKDCKAKLPKPKPDGTKCRQEAREKYTKMRKEKCGKSRGCQMRMHRKMTIAMRKCPK